MRWHIGFWLIGLFVGMLALPIIFTQELVMKRVGTEIGYLTNAFGEQDAKTIVDGANSFFDDWFVKTGIISSLGKAYAVDENKDRTEKILGQTVNKLTGATNSYVMSFAANIYAMTLRVNILLTWAVYILPFLGAAIVHGFVKRKIKILSFGYVSPSAYGIALHSIIALTFFPLLYLLAPFAITPLFMPFWAMVLSVPVIMMMSNIQRING